MESNDKDRLMKEIQLCTFSLVEANLYLDTHPCDQEALRFYQKTEKRLQELREQYEEKYGKIAAGEDGQLRWAWVDNPWPWQMGV